MGKNFNVQVNDRKRFGENQNLISIIGFGLELLILLKYGY